MVTLLISLILCAPLVGAFWLLMVVGQGLRARGPEAIALGVTAAAYSIDRRAPLPIATELARLRLGLIRRLRFTFSPAMLAMTACLLALGVHLGCTENTLFAHGMAWLTVIVVPGFAVLMFLAVLVVDGIEPIEPSSWPYYLLPLPGRLTAPSVVLDIPLEPPRPLSAITA